MAASAPAAAAASQRRLPHKITLDGYQASHRAASEVLGEHPRGKSMRDPILKIFE
jgi:hypothetical protein